VIKQHVPNQQKLYSLLYEVNPIVKEDSNPDTKGTTYYVDSFNGNDRYDGRLPGRAWKTLQNVNTTTFRPGDRILFRRGGIWFGKLAPAGNGSIGAPITI